LGGGQPKNQKKGKPQGEGSAPEGSARYFVRIKKHQQKQPLLPASCERKTRKTQNQEGKRMQTRGEKGGENNKGGVEKKYSDGVQKLFIASCVSSRFEGACWSEKVQRKLRRGRKEFRRCEKNPTKTPCLKEGVGLCRFRNAPLPNPPHKEVSITSGNQA